MVAPDFDVVLSTGETVPLRSLFERDKVALVFLRHLGCVFCREHVAQLRRYPELNIAFVTLGTVEQTEAFRIAMKSPHRFICDPEKRLHQAFNLNKGGLAQMISPRVVARAIGATLSGHFQSATTVGDPMQMPGVFVIAPSGEVTWEHRSRDAADNPSPQEIERHLSGE